MAVLFACYILTEVLRISSSTWLSYWTDQNSSENYKPAFFIVIYALLSFGQVSLDLATLSLGQIHPPQSHSSSLYLLYIFIFPKFDQFLILISTSSHCCYVIVTFSSCCFIMLDFL